MEIVILGGGPGGYVAAIHAARSGAKVTLIEKDKLGGTCLNRGCIPTKAILHSANLLHEVRNGKEIGIEADGVSVNFAAVMSNKDNIVTKLTGGVGYLLKKNNVRVITGEAKFLDAHRVSAGGQEIRADHFIIATGSAPSDLPFAKADGNSILNSDHIMKLTTLPKSLAIVGGGVIGCEIAQALARMGCKVSVIEMLPRLIANMDEEQSALLEKTMKSDGVDIFLDHAIEAITPDAGGVKIAYTSPDRKKQNLTAEKVLLAAGRRPNSADLALEKAGVAITSKGYISTDTHMRTNVPTIYAIGDITGNIQLAHVASHQGIIAVNNILGHVQQIDYAAVPQCIYTSPELASVGLSEGDAEKQGALKVGRFSASGNGRAMIERSDGFSKIIADKGTGVIRGIHLAGPMVTEMISGMAALVQFEAATSDMEDVIFAHPSVSEMIHESILDADGMAIHQ
ncbi:MAG: dihydrolipoyl dehydrogenase [Christensenella sp.]|uniref:dihydrolipoyl dehydrogenase n=1 Tax=Christensenella sp. TaxID=1935934 RepID=UPI002B212167|nr:dihydrolipoyl dehydrogenase [Christensenella sp.]MEA5004585.1 dihydrolipoyl dehydrogenase [Christensenella sp.]